MKQMSAQLEGFLKSAGILDSLGNAFKSMFNGNNVQSPLYGLSERVRNATQAAQQSFQPAYSNAQQYATPNYSNIWSRLQSDYRRGTMHTEQMDNAQQTARRLMQENNSNVMKYRNRVSQQLQKAQQSIPQVSSPNRPLAQSR